MSASMSSAARWLSSLLVVALFPSGGAAQSGAFVITLGKDTTAIERFTRTGNTVTGDLVTRQAGTTIQHYTLTLNGDGTPATLVVTPRRPDGTAIPNGFDKAQATFSADSVISVMSRDTMAMTRRIGVKRAFPGVGGGLMLSIGMYDVLFEYMRAHAIDSVGFTTIGATTPRAGNESFVKRFSPDSARIWISFPPPTPAGPYPQYVRLDPAGHVLGFSGRETTQKIEAVRVASLDFDRLVAGFAAAERAGSAFGARGTSTADSVRATVGSAHIKVDYYRPSARGRDVFKHGVLGDTLWRTGANTATMFTTDADLVIDGKTIPAGSYTLWTHAAPDNRTYELIFNTQTKQWGTDYHADRDLVRVPLRVSALSSPVEAFRIAVQPQGNGGAILLEWVNTSLSTAFTVKRE
jgi:hypothetical protein